MEWKYWFDIDDNGSATMYHTSASGNGFKVHKCVSVTLVEQCILPLMDMLDAEVRTTYVVRYTSRKTVSDEAYEVCTIKAV